MEDWTGQCCYWCRRSTGNKKEQGTTDAWGNQLYVTEPAFCDEIAASSGLLMSKAGKCPAILLEGLAGVANMALQTTFYGNKMRICLDEIINYWRYWAPR